MAMGFLQTNLSINGANWEFDVEGNPHVRLLLFLTVC
jgi:hypothetical protein